jgi:hypothetical protein
LQCNLPNKELDNEKLCRESPDFIGKHLTELGEKSNVKMEKPGKAGGGGVLCIGEVKGIIECVPLLNVCL